MPTTTAITGCAGSTTPAPKDAREARIEMHTMSALLLHATLEDVEHAIEQRAAKDYAAIDVLRLPAEEAAARKLKVKHDYAPVEAAYALTANAYDAWIAAITAASTKDVEILQEFAAALLSRWRSLLDATELLGLGLPEIPDFLRRMADGS